MTAAITVTIRTVRRRGLIAGNRTLPGSSPNTALHLAVQAASDGDLPGTSGELLILGHRNSDASRNSQADLPGASYPRTQPSETDGVSGFERKARQ